MRNERGLTLLEVMAAVAILGLVYTVLARAGTQGILSEGRSRDLLEASLLADATLSEIESELSYGYTPEPGVTEQEVDEFLVTVEVRTWEPPRELAELLAPPTLRPGESFPSVFGSGTPRDPGFVEEIAVRVSWFDGVGERSVERVTFGVDVVGAAASLVPGAAAGGTGG